MKFEKRVQTLQTATKSWINKMETLVHAAHDDHAAGHITTQELNYILDCFQNATSAYQRLQPETWL